MQRIRALWMYRSFIAGMVKREFQGRYTRSVLGSLWAIIEPLSMILVYSVIFSKLMAARFPGFDSQWAFTIYICSGIIAWEFFTEVITRSQNMFIEHASLLKKTSFPRVTLPVIALTTATINFIIIFSIYLCFLAIIGELPSYQLLLAWIPLLIIQQGIAVGLGLIIGTLNVFFRDIGQAMQIILRFWFWLTPIVYPFAILPDFVKDLVLSFNPMTLFIIGYHKIMLYNELPVFTDFKLHFLLMLSLMFIGSFFFIRLSPEMVDEL
jgi:lipopolysaccharide transport system permease protein